MHPDHKGDVRVVHLTPHHRGAHGGRQCLGAQTRGGPSCRNPLRGSQCGQIRRRLGAMAGEDGGPEPHAANGDPGEGGNQECRQHGRRAGIVTRRVPTPPLRGPR